MAEIKSITIRGFKSISRVSNLSLGAINVLIGANGSGKSNFIGAFELLHEIRHGRLQTYVAKAGGAGRVLHYGRKTTQALELDLELCQPNNFRNTYSLKLEPTAEDELIPVSEVVSFDPGTHPRAYVTTLLAQGNEAGISGRANRDVLAHLQGRLDRWRIFHFHDTGKTSPIKGTGEIEDNRALRPDAANLAAFLRALKFAHPKHYEAIRSAVRQVAPFLADFVLEPKALNPNTIRLEWQHEGFDAFFDGSSLSDGTLRFIALATLLLQPMESRPSVILLDEPELGLHPSAITVLASLLHQAAMETQIILATQSALLLDHFEPEDVLIAERIDGGTQLRRLESDPLQEWLEDYSLGQLWEKNELGGRP